jgi:hypothetical protein
MLLGEGFHLAPLTSLRKVCLTVEMERIKLLVAPVVVVLVSVAVFTVSLMRL